MKHIIYILFLFTICSCCENYNGYHVYCYIAGDENHTCYEDTILWGYTHEDVKRYTDSLSYKYSIIHTDPVTLSNYPQNTKKVTKDQVLPKIGKYKHTKNYCNDTTKTMKDTVKHIKTKKHERNIRIRTNGSVDIGSGVGQPSYNLRSGKIGIRTTKHTVIDGDGIHFNF